MIREIPKDKVRQNADQIVVVKSDLCVDDDELRFARVRAGLPVKDLVPPELYHVPTREEAPLAPIVLIKDIVKPIFSESDPETHDLDVCSCLRCATMRNYIDMYSRADAPAVEIVAPDEAIRRKWLLEDQTKKHTSKAKTYAIDLERRSGGSSLRKTFKGMTERDVAGFTKHEEFAKSLGQANLDKVDVEMYRAVASGNYSGEDGLKELIATYGHDAGRRFPKVESLIIQHAFRIGLLVLPGGFGERPPDPYPHDRDEREDMQDDEMRIEWKKGRL
ncbi:MAG: hypothetical protein WBL50_18380 [Candidatus Acidiferrum sp.]